MSEPEPRQGEQDPEQPQAGPEGEDLEGVVGEELEIARPRPPALMRLLVPIALAAAVLLALGPVLFFLAYSKPVDLLGELRVTVSGADATTAPAEGERTVRVPAGSTISVEAELLAPAHLYAYRLDPSDGITPLMTHAPGLAGAPREWPALVSVGRWRLSETPGRVTIFVVACRTPLEKPDAAVRGLREAYARSGNEEAVLVRIRSWAADVKTVHFDVLSPEAGVTTDRASPTDERTTFVRATRN